uniref:Uncharacterized protein n=1 Tax=Arundo donax TaxID=35708 RepID=A0A0A9BTS6_ARUDO
MLGEGLSLQTGLRFISPRIHRQWFTPKAYI